MSRTTTEGFQGDNVTRWSEARLSTKTFPLRGSLSLFISIMDIAFFFLHVHFSVLMFTVRKRNWQKRDTDTTIKKEKSTFEK